MGFLDRLFKARPERGANDAPRSPFRLYGGSRNLISYKNVVAAEEALEHPIIFRCLNKIASSVQTVKWYCEADPDVPTGEQAGATIIKNINALLRAPNDSLAPDQLKFWMALNYAVYGRAGFKVGISAIDRKTPNGIYPLDMRYLKAVPSDRGTTVKYEYGSSDNKQTLVTRRASEDGKNGESYAHEIFTPSLAGTQNSSAVLNKNINALSAIGLPSDVIKNLLQRAIDTATGHFNGKYVVSGEKTMTKPQEAALKEHLEETGTAGGEDSGKILYLPGANIKIDKLDNDLSDIHSKIPLDDMTRIIAGAFGIPLAMMGIGGADAAKFAGNYAESRMAFWADTIVPSYLVPMATGMTVALCPPGARIVFDLDSIDALADSRIARAAKLATVGFLTTTEKRELCGYGPNAVFPEIMETKTAATPADTKTNSE